MDLILASASWATFNAKKSASNVEEKQQWATAKDDGA
jgi:hypothetical protein